jgi:hypothetical protein
MPIPPSSADPTRDGQQVAVAHLWYDPLIGAARDLERLTSAYHAELLVSTLLGSVYAVTTPDDGDRAAAVETFAAGFRGYLLDRTDPASALLRAVLDALIPPAAPHAPAPATAPAWVPRLGTATVTGASAYGDGYGDQVNYLLICDYPDAELGGPQHVVSVLVDRNLGIVKDLFVAAPAEAVLTSLRAGVLPEDGSYLVEVDPATLRAAVTTAMTATDHTPATIPPVPAKPAGGPTAQCDGPDGDGADGEGRACWTPATTPRSTPTGRSPSRGCGCWRYRQRRPTRRRATAPGPPAGVPARRRTGPRRSPRPSGTPPRRSAWSARPATRRRSSSASI